MLGHQSGEDSLRLSGWSWYAATPPEGVQEAEGNTETLDVGTLWPHSQSLCNELHSTKKYVEPNVTDLSTSSASGRVASRTGCPGTEAAFAHLLLSGLPPGSTSVEVDPTSADFRDPLALGRPRWSGG